MTARSKICLDTQTNPFTQHAVCEGLEGRVFRLSGSCIKRPFRPSSGCGLRDNGADMLLKAGKLKFEYPIGHYIANKDGARACCA